VRALIRTTVAHYRIEEKLGEGGMGEVYRAHDTKLNRDVALKFLPPRLLDNEIARKRFLREAESIASLEHPYICNIKDVLQTDEGNDFIVMEYVEGQTLKEKLEEGPLPISEAVRIASEAADALIMAHERGIVHRDLKPSNIMLTVQGHVKVMDFGLAKRVLKETTDKDISTTLTREGSTLGTLAYMSPEQVKAKAVDHRSDIFSFGVVLFEMLSGVHPFRKTGQAETIAAILRAEPAPLKRYIDDVNELLENTVQKMLAKDPAERYQSIHEIRTDLRVLLGQVSGRPKLLKQRIPSVFRSLLLIIGTFILMGFSYFIYETIFHNPTTVLGFQNRDWIVISDFENHTEESEFDRSLSLALTVGIQQSQYVNVLPKARIEDTLNRMQRSDISRIDQAVASEIAIREGAKAVLIGSISRIGSQYLLTAQIVDPQTQVTVLSERTTAADRTKILESLDELGRQIRERLGESLSSINELGLTLPEATTRSLEALAAFAQARRAEGQERINFLKEAIRRDAEFALAHADLGTELYILGERSEGDNHFRQAMDLVDRLTHREQLWIPSVVEDWRGNREEAIRKYKIYLAEYPDDGGAWFRLGWSCMITNRLTDGVDAFKEVIRINPSHSGAFVNLATCFKAMKRYQDALTSYRQAFELNPEQLTGTYVNSEYGFMLVALGKVDEARKTFEKMLQQENDKKAVGYRSLALLDMSLGTYSHATEFLQEAIRLRQGSHQKLSEFRDRLFLANAWRTMGNQDEFKQEMREVERLHSEVFLAPFWLYLLGRTYARDDRIEKATNLLKQISESMQDPLAFSGVSRSDQLDEVAFQLLKGEIEVSQGKFDSAIDSFTKAEAISPEHWPIEALAHAYYLKGDFQKANSKYQELIAINELGYEIQESTILAHYYVGKIQEQLGNKKAAVKSYSRFLEIWKAADEDLQPVIEAKKALDRLTPITEN
jgi:serine/threonine protein kinase/tetratricopeptide (TPR) repeat protein